jgi:phage FluMu protein Com
MKKPDEGTHKATKSETGAKAKPKTRGRRKKQVPEQSQTDERCPKCNKLLFKASGDYYIRIRCPRCGYQTNIKNNHKESRPD